MSKKFSRFLSTTTAIASIAKFRLLADMRTRWYTSHYSQSLRLKPHSPSSIGLSWGAITAHGAALGVFRFLSVVNYLRPRQREAIPFLFCQYALWLQRQPTRGS